jgi:hypothetical protein
MALKKNCDFSYAGLKTAVRLAVEKHVGDEPPSDDNRQVCSCTAKDCFGLAEKPHEHLLSPLSHSILASVFNLYDHLQVLVRVQLTSKWSAINSVSLTSEVERSWLCLTT